MKVRLDIATKLRCNCKKGGTAGGGFLLIFKSVIGRIQNKYTSISYANGKIYIVLSIPLCDRRSGGGVHGSWVHTLNILASREINSSGSGLSVAVVVIVLNRGLQGV